MKNSEQKADLLPSYSIAQSNMLGEGGKPIPLPVSFLEWVSFEGYMRLSKEVGHKWFKIGKPKNYTTIELFNLFVKEIEDEIRNNDLDAYNKQMEFEASRFGGL